MNVSEDANGHQCQKRFFDTVNPALKGGFWTEEEDEKLRRAVVAFSGVSVPALSVSGEGRDMPSASGRPPISWQDVALFVPGRNNNQCREHFQLLAKDKNRVTRQGSKGKGRTEALDETAEESNASDAEKTGVTNATKKRTAKPRPRSAVDGKRKGKAMVDINSEDASSDENGANANTDTGDDPVEAQQGDGDNQGEEASELIPRAGPQPRPRKRSLSVFRLRLWLS